MTQLSHRRAEVDGGGGLADAALLVDDRQNRQRRGAQYVGPSSSGSNYILGHVGTWAVTGCLDSNAMPALQRPLRPIRRPSWPGGAATSRTPIPRASRR